METIALEVTAVLVAKAIIQAIKYLKLQYEYVKNMNKNFAKLEREEKYLYQIVENFGTRSGKKFLPLEIWLDEVKTMVDEIEELRIAYQSSHVYLCGIPIIFPSPRSLKLGKRLVKTTEEVIFLKNQLHQMGMIFEQRSTSVIKAYFDKIFRRILRACFIYT